MLTEISRELKQPMLRTVEQEVGVLLVVHIEGEDQTVDGERKEILCQLALRGKMAQDLPIKKRNLNILPNRQQNISYSGSVHPMSSIPLSDGQ